MQRKSELDGLRALAFLSVFIHHALQVPMLWAGVDLFFVLSGYLITGILVREKGKPRYFRRFYARRFLRIIPPYYLALVIVFAFFYSGHDWWIYATFTNNFRQSFSEGGSADLVPMWSLAIEEQFYLLWPLLIWLLSKRQMARLCLSLIVFAVLVRLILTLVSTTHWPVYFLLPSRIDLLAGGSLIALWEVSYPAWFKQKAQGGLVLAVVCFAIFLILSIAKDFRTGANSILFNTLGYSLVAGVCIGLVAYVVTHLGSRLLSPLRWRPLTYLGMISYMMYLCHLMVLNHTGGSSLVHAALALIIVIAFSSLSWFLMERPLQKLKQKF